jgi:hypothetical protein
MQVDGRFQRRGGRSELMRVDAVDQAQAALAKPAEECA